MTQVRLLPSAFLDAAEWNRGYMNRLPADRLLHSFRLNAGLPSSAEPLGGWEIYVPRRPASGATAKANCAATSPATSSPPARSSTPPWATRKPKPKADYMVAELAKCQQKLGASGYLSAFPIEWFDRLDARKPVWAPFYTIHKIMAGMLDMYQLAGNKQALEVLEGMSRLGRRLVRIENRRAHAGHPEHRVRRHERGALQPGRRHRQRPLGQGRRPLHQEALLQSAGAAPRRAARPAREHAHSAGDRRRPALRDFGRHALPRRRRFLLVRGDHRAQLRDQRHQQRRRLADAAAHAGRRTEAQRGHRRMLLLVQHAEADAPSLQLERRLRAISTTTSARC